MYDVVLINSHSISYLGSRINNAPHYLELKLTFQGRRHGLVVEDVHSLVKYSGELRHGSSLHAGFYDLILFFPVSSFILTLDGCV